MTKSLKIMALSAALTGIAAPVFADGGHHHMTTFQSIVHFLSSPTHGLITLGAVAVIGFVAVKFLRKRS
jgi:hypothetical protein